MDINAIWEVIKPYFTAGTISTAIATIIGIIFKTLITKKLNKINLEEIEQKAVESGVEKIKDVAFKCDITPIVESKLVDIEQKALLAVKEQVNTMKVQYANMLEVLKGISAYFDDSYLISQDKKDAVQKAIEDAEKELPKEETIVINAVVKDNAKVEDKKVNVER